MTPEQARARIAKLEALADRVGPLNAADQAELRRLEAAYALFRPIDDMSMAELDAYLAWHAGADAGRLDHLRRRTLSPQEQAEQRTQTIGIEAMSMDELDQWMSERALAAREPPA